MHQGVPNDELLSDSDFTRLDFDVTQDAQVADQRQNDKAMMALIKAMFVELRSIREEAKIMRQDLHVHIQDEKLVIAHAFPAADTDGHRRAHEAWINKAEAQAKFWETLYTTLKVSGVLAVCGFLLTAGWVAFLKGPPK